MGEARTNASSKLINFGKLSGAKQCRNRASKRFWSMKKLPRCIWKRAWWERAIVPQVICMGNAPGGSANACVDTVLSPLDGRLPLGRDSREAQARCLGNGNHNEAFCQNGRKLWISHQTIANLPTRRHRHRHTHTHISFTIGEYGCGFPWAG